MHGCTGVHLQTILENEFQMALSILAWNLKSLLKKNEYISFITKPTNVFKYTGLSFSVIFVVSNLHIFVLTFRLEDQKWHKDWES